MIASLVCIIAMLLLCAGNMLADDSLGGLTQAEYDYFEYFDDWELNLPNLDSEVEELREAAQRKAERLQELKDAVVAENPDYEGLDFYELEEAIHEKRVEYNKKNAETSNEDTEENNLIETPPKTGDVAAIGWVCLAAILSLFVTCGTLVCIKK